MGTSVSQRSPKNTAWSMLSVAYTSKSIPAHRVPTLVWRAVDNTDSSITKFIASAGVFACHQAVTQTKSSSQAYAMASKHLQSNKQNSVVSEFAKRAISSAFVSQNPSKQWRANFFAEVTNYLVSRDLSGFLGESFRNKTVGELTHFKQSIQDEVRGIINRVPGEPRTHSQWNSYVRIALEQLTQRQE